MIKDKEVKVNSRRAMRFHVEHFDSAQEVARTCTTRQITSTLFDDMRERDINSWFGVKSYDEALELLRNGYQPTVDAMGGVFRASRNGVAKRITFQNEIQGFAPVVPLALKGVPNCMVNMTMKPIKAKVIDVCYDMTASCSVNSSDIIKAGQALLGTIVELEKQGYRFNIYAVQSYSDETSCDMLAVKVKSSGQPLDLKRISFPLTHTAFFRVIGFDWYSKVPGGKHRSGYGHALGYEINNAELQESAKQLFGKSAVYFSAANIIGKDKESIKEVLTNGNSKA